MIDSSDAELALRVIDFLNNGLGPGPKITVDSRLAQDLVEAAKVKTFSKGPQRVKAGE
jgi:hypothetical protein